MKRIIGTWGVGVVASLLLAGSASAEELTAIEPIWAKNALTNQIWIGKHVYEVKPSTVIREQMGDRYIDIKFGAIDVLTISGPTQPPNLSTVDARFVAKRSGDTLVLERLDIVPYEQ